MFAQFSVLQGHTILKCPATFAQERRNREGDFQDSVFDLWWELKDLSPVRNMSIYFYLLSQMQGFYNSASAGKLSRAGAGYSY